MVYATVIAAVIVIPIELGGYGKIFASIDPKTAASGPRQRRTIWDRALPIPRWRWVRCWRCFFIPHATTGMLSSSSRDVVERNSIILPIYSFALALIALLGFMAVAAGVKAMPGYAARLRPLRQQFRRAGAVPHHVSQLVRGRGLRRHRRRRAGAGRDHVHRLRQPFHPQYLSRLHRARLHAAGARPASPRSSPSSPSWAPCSSCWR